LKRLRGIAAAGALCGALVAAPVSSARAQSLLARFEASPTAFSPDGDGFSDSTVVTYALADTALSFSIVVFAADAVTPVDTLLAPGPGNVLGTLRVSWKGARWDGTPVGEGSYVVTLDARGQSRPDTTVSLFVFVDVTRPVVQINGVDPPVYAPGLAGASSVLSAWIAISTSSPAPPGRTPDELRLTILNPSGAPISYDTSAVAFEPPLSGPAGRFVRRDTTYHMTWDASGQTGLADGSYTIRVALVDVATGTAETQHGAQIDVRLPSAGVTSPSSGSRHQVVPDTLRGWTYDRSGIDSLRIRYGPTRPYTDITPALVRNDTVFFAVPLADSVLADGEHTFTIRSVDRVGWALEHLYQITWDRTAPAAPVLDPFDGAWRNDTFRLSGDVEDLGDSEARVRVYRGGTVIDSVFTALLEERFQRDVPLQVGGNLFTITLVDGANNESAHSNAVRVTFDNSGGLFIPAPLRPGDAFAVNLTREADGVELRLYDLSGNLVVRLEDRARRQYYQITWDGRNADGADARKGPLVAVATISYADGGRETIRQIFLLETQR